ncbi:YrdB family protein [Arthrobacter rhombi]|uniref:YrdB family protein n=1 Tax=Arthrobacter rhombi TaxID=71253 RepID=UPI003FD4922B
MEDEPQNAAEVVTDEPSGTPIRPAGILAFVLEVALLCAAGLWAIKFLPLAPVVAVLVLLIPLVVLWGLLLSPQAPWRLGWPIHPVVAHVLFLVGVAALWSAGHGWLAGIMLVLTLVSIVMNWLKREELASGAVAQRSKRRRPAGRRAAR